MKIPPVFVRLKISPRDSWIPTLWLPVFLLWPFVLVVMLFVYVLGILAVTLLARPSIGKYRQLGGGLYDLVCELRGIKIDVEDRNAHVLIVID